MIKIYLTAFLLGCKKLTAPSFDYAVCKQRKPLTGLVYAFYSKKTII